MRPRRGAPRATRAGEREDGEGVGEVGGEGVFAEELVGDGDEPEGEWRLFDVADAVGLGGDPVAAVDDVLRGLGVGSVDVVHEGRREEGREVDGGEEEKEDQPRRQRGGR